LNQPQPAADPKLREQVERLVKDYQVEADQLRGLPASKDLKEKVMDAPIEMRGRRTCRG